MRLNIPWDRFALFLIVPWPPHAGTMPALIVGAQ